jgi:hypothetical protein
MCFPVSFQLVFQIELAAQVGEEAAIPLLTVEALADGGKIEDSHRDTFHAEASGGVHHQGTLAHLAAGKHVAELAGFKALVQLLIRLPLDVGGSVGTQGAASNVEGRG